MTDDIQSFMQQNAGGGAPGFWFGQIGAAVTGSIAEMRVTERTKPKTTPPEKIPDANDPTGYARQLEITLQTNLTGWQGLKKVPTDQVQQPNGLTVEVPRDPSKDDGKRRIFAHGNLLFQLGAAVRAGGNPTGTPRVGDLLHVKYAADRETGQPSPAKQYEVQYRPGDPSAQALVQQAAPQAPPQQAPQPQFQQPVAPQGFDAAGTPAQQWAPPQGVPASYAQNPQVQQAQGFPPAQAAPQQPGPGFTGAPAPAQDPWATPVQPQGPAPSF